MDLLDLIIALLVVGAVVSGLRRGLSWVSLSLLGLAVGIILGAVIAGPLARRIGGHNSGNEALIGTGIFLAVVSVIQGVGTGLGYRVRLATLRTRLAQVDSGGGAALAAVGVLVFAWFLGYTFADSPYARLDAQIQGSTVLRHLDSVFPRPPAFLLQLRQILRDPGLGPSFAGLGAPDVSPLDIPPTADTPGIRTAAASVSKVLSEGCGLEAGSAWPMGGDLFVTNAHVVAGGQRVTLQTPNGRGGLDATVVLFDPETDVAVLRVPNASVPALTMAGDPARGLTGAVIGYPRGGPLQVVPAAIRGIESARGDDIYGTQTVTRSIEVLAAQVIPGNSGGPIVDAGGTVVGLVFAASTSDPNEGYALSISQISDDLAAARGRTAAVSTQGCTN